MSTLSLDHRSSSGLGLTVCTLNTPLSRAIRCSPDLGSMPTHIPSSQRSSHFPGMSFVFGMRKCTFSPMCINLELARRPFISWNAVLPEGRTRHRVIKYPAWRISHGTMGWFSLILHWSFSSTADRRVRIMPMTSCTERSTVALVLDSPTDELSSAVPYSLDRFLATSLAMSFAELSWSVLTSTLSFFRPTVSKSSHIWSTTHCSELPLCSTA